MTWRAKSARSYRTANAAMSMAYIRSPHHPEVNPRILPCSTETVSMKYGAVQESQREYALDRDRSMIYLQGECSYRCAAEEKEEEEEIRHRSSACFL
jgi:hypothetical protein